MPTRNPAPQFQERPRTPAAPPESGRPGALEETLPGDETAAWLGERLRRLALGATAALLVARAYWASEPDFRADAGGGMTWVAAVLVVAGIALVASLLVGSLRLRRSWADAALVGLVLLVGLSASHAIDRRAAINVAWEWGGIGLVYLLLRNLPRTRGESKALAGVLTATAVALAVYGLYQAGVEMPEFQARYLRNREEGLRVAGVAPGTPAQAAFESRLLGSNEPFATFGLANSLAGYLVGPLVVMLAAVWRLLTDRAEGSGSRGGRVGAFLLALPPVLAVAVCLMMTKSRSAWLGLLAGGLVLAWRERTRVRSRTLVLAAVGAAAVVAALAAAGLATGRLDKEVLTQTGKSLGVRLHYWRGAWDILNQSPRAFWRGLGPGNFVAPYVRVKPVEAGEEVSDPHDLFLEVWTTAGVVAVVALLAALAVGLRGLLGPPRPGSAGEGANASAARPRDDGSPAPRGTAWVFLWGGAGGWIGVVLLGQLNPFLGDLFFRWLILGAAWGLALVCGLGLWRRTGSVTPSACGAAAVAVLVNLTAAGGISVPAVALMLWGFLALGLNLRDDRPESVPVESGGRLGAFALAAVWAALVGTFVGAVGPYFRVEAALAEAEDALRARPPAVERAEAAYRRAGEADQYTARPWLSLAALDYQTWLNRGAKPEDLRWRKIPIEMYKAVQAPRAANSWSRHRERARVTSLLLKQLGGSLTPQEITRYRGDVVQSSRTAVRLYPTHPSLRAWLAEASAAIGMYPDAINEAREALRLDSLTPNPEKHLDPNVRLWLQTHLPDWEKTAAAPPPEPLRKGKP